MERLASQSEERERKEKEKGENKEKKWRGEAVVVELLGWRTANLRAMESWLGELQRGSFSCSHGLHAERKRKEMRKKKESKKWRGQVQAGGKTDKMEIASTDHNVPSWQNETQSFADLK